jgi:Aldehyde dehydrogenase family
MLSTTPDRARIDLSAIPSVIPNLIGGRDVLPSEGRLFAKIDPATGGEICKVARSTAADVRAAVHRARQAQPAWAAMTVVKRGEILRRIAILMQEHRAAIGDLVARETGKSRKDALGETDAAIEMGFFVAGEGRRFYGQTTTSAVPNKSAMIVRQPLGVAGLIIAANTPIANVAWKAFPALLCGNAAILKAAEDTPLSAWAFGVLAHEAGVSMRRCTGSVRKLVRRLSSIPTSRSSALLARARLDVTSPRAPAGAWQRPVSNSVARTRSLSVTMPIWRMPSRGRWARRSAMLASGVRLAAGSSCSTPFTIASRRC